MPYFGCCLVIGLCTGDKQAAVGGSMGHVPHSFESLNWSFCYTTPFKQKLHSIVVKTCDGAEVCDVPVSFWRCHGVLLSLTVLLHGGVMQLCSETRFACQLCSESSGALCCAFSAGCFLFASRLFVFPSVSLAEMLVLLWLLFSKLRLNDCRVTRGYK